MDCAASRMSSGFADQHAAVPASEASQREDELRLTFMRFYVKGQASDCVHVYVCGAWCEVGEWVGGCVCVSDLEGYHICMIYICDIYIYIYNIYI